MPTVLDLEDVSVVRNGNRILDSINWKVEADQRWVILGPNGAGKTTLLNLASAMVHPTSGTAQILDSRMGRVDVFELRPRVGFASSAMAKRFPGDETVLNVVLTAAYSVTGRWNEQYDEIDLRRAQRVLAEWRLDHLEERLFGSLSDGGAEACTDRPLGDDRPRAAAARRAGRFARPRCARGAAAAARRLRLGPVSTGHRHGHTPRRRDPAGLHPRAADLERVDRPPQGRFRMPSPPKISRPPSGCPSF